MGAKTVNGKEGYVIDFEVAVSPGTIFLRVYQKHDNYDGYAEWNQSSGEFLLFALNSIFGCVRRIDYNLVDFIYTNYIKSFKNLYKRKNQFFSE